MRIGWRLEAGGWRLETGGWRLVENVSKEIRRMGLGRSSTESNIMDFNPSYSPRICQKENLAQRRGDAERIEKGILSVSAALRDRNDIWRRPHEILAEKTGK